MQTPEKPDTPFMRLLADNTGKRSLSVAQHAFNQQGILRDAALDAISTVLSEGGNVFVDMPEALHYADAFNKFAHDVMKEAHTKADGMAIARGVMTNPPHSVKPRALGHILFNQPSAAAIIETPVAPRRR